MEAGLAGRPGKDAVTPPSSSKNADMSENAVGIEELLQHERWMRHLARRLVRDEASADDLVQQTWLEALRRPHRSIRAARGFLGSVVLAEVRNRL